MNGACNSVCPVPGVIDVARVPCPVKRMESESDAGAVIVTVLDVPEPELLAL